jgi:hypothetical protein
MGCFKDRFLIASEAADAAADGVVDVVEWRWRRRKRRERTNRWREKF